MKKIIKLKKDNKFYLKSSGYLIPISTSGTCCFLSPDQTLLNDEKTILETFLMDSVTNEQQYEKILGAEKHPLDCSSV